MPSQGDYRLLAQYFLGLAKACTEPSNADRYRAIAADYFDRAGQVGESSPVAHSSKFSARRKRITLPRGFATSKASLDMSKEADRPPTQC
jgi:hypothetical protein